MSYLGAKRALRAMAKQFIEDTDANGGLDNMPAVWGNADFTPPSNGSYVAVYIMPASSEVATLGVGGQDEHVGMMQLSFYTPMQEGEDAIDILVNKAKIRFSSGAKSTYSGQVVYIFKAVKDSPCMKDDDRYVSHCTISWRTRTARPTNLTHTIT